MTAVFEMVVGWSMRMLGSHKARTETKLLNSALDFAGVQEQAAKEKAAEKKKKAEEKRIAGDRVGYKRRPRRGRKGRQ